ncbi:MAG: hypothetical protein EU529_10500 [Promethearchaeota archaeon]|nr:MAG: hypothetical protein EU529_10500 [Candidatus Lokiarchaeota archaeon]
MLQFLILQEYWIIFLPAFLLGLLHTVMPCEDKALFCFYSFGVTKDPKSSFFILTLYGLGLMTANLTIAIISILVILIPLILLPSVVLDPHAITFFGAFSSTFVAITFLFFITRKEYFPHSKYKDSIMNLDWNKRRTPYIFGLLAGFPPCLFELYIYSQCLIFSLSYGWLEGFFTVFYFSLGTLIGLFPLALAKRTAETIKPFPKETKTKMEGSEKTKKNTIYVIMLLIIIGVNIIIMVLSFLEINLFTVSQIK